MTSSPAEISFSREMAYSHRDFWRTLPRAIEGQPYEIGDKAATIGNDCRRVLIELGEEGERAIALLRIPKTEVRFRFTGYSQADVDAFMERFDLYFRKGGG
ncbi:MAG: hypothetical protein ACR2RB_05795 [Gammaproteobacteria bacterium]